MKNKAKTKIISIFAVMVVLASVFGVIVMAANSLGEDTTTTEKTVDECNFYAIGYDVWSDTHTQIKGTIYANVSESREVFVNAQFENLPFSSVREKYPIPEKRIEFITLTPSWKITEVKVQCSDRTNTSIVSNSPINGSNMLTVFYPGDITKPPISGYLQVRITPSNINNPPDKCCVQGRVICTHRPARPPAIFVVDSCTTTVNF